MSGASSDESISRASSEEELFDVQDNDTAPVFEVRGAEPYRYEPVVDVAAQWENADVDGVAVVHAGQQNRLGNSEWLVVYSSIISEWQVWCFSAKSFLRLRNTYPNFDLRIPPFARALNMLNSLTSPQANQLYFSLKLAGDFVIRATQWQ